MLASVPSPRSLWMVVSGCLIIKASRYFCMSFSFYRTASLLFLRPCFSLFSTLLAPSPSLFLAAPRPYTHIPSNFRNETNIFVDTKACLNKTSQTFKLHIMFRRILLLLILANLALLTQVSALCNHHQIQGLYLQY